MAGPTSFAPVIDMAVTIVEQSSGQYHVLLIIADGQVISVTNFGPYKREKEIELCITNHFGPT